MDERYLDECEAYEELFDPLKTDRKARRSRRPKARHRPKKSRQEIVTEVADPTGLEEGFNPSYRPGLFEEGWLLQALRAFYDQQIIRDVLMRVRGGKEANVYCCAPGEAAPEGVGLLAAKVYRPRMFRNLRNDKLYREGRAILTAEGRPIKTTDHRLMRAVGKKTALGEQVQHTSWLMHEYTALQRLYEAGAAVPRPLAASENAILMSYCGDARLAAPTLHEVRLTAAEAGPLLEEVLRNVALMLRHGLVHGDLSAYNILYWEGAITIIDFPQVVQAGSNAQAYAILRRDIARVCAYFARQGVDCDPEGLAEALGRRYLAGRLLDRLADASRAAPEEEA